MKCSESARIDLSDQEIAKPLSSLCPLICFAHPAGGRLWRSISLRSVVVNTSGSGITILFAPHHPSMGTGKILKGLTGLVFRDLTRSWIPGAISGWRA